MSTPDTTPAVVPASAKKPANKRVLVVVVLVALAALAAGGRMWWRSTYFVETDNAYLAGHVHPVSSRVAGVITKVLVEDNQIVKAGDVLAELDPADQQLRIEQIEAQIASANQQIVQADAQVAQARAQAGAAKAQIAQAAALAQRTRQDAQRYNQLYSDSMKAVSRVEVDAANAALAGASADLAARNNAASAAGAQIAATQAARDVLRAQIKVLQVQLKDARQQLGYNRVSAPVAGRLGKRALEVGARVQPGQQLAAIVQDTVWVTANFKETQLAKLRPGQHVHVHIDAIADQILNGTIDSFSPASGNQFSLLPADNATGNFTKIVQRVPVKIAIAAAEQQALRGRLVPGMSAQIEVDLHSSENKALDAKTQTARAQ
ncbi:MAG TPA: HlyD family secretion protein [Burkholderiaceae bacterium]